MASVSGWSSQFPQHFYLPWPVPFLPCAAAGLGYPALAPPVLLPPCVDVSGLAFAVPGQRRADPYPLRDGRVMVSSEAQTDPPESCGESESGRGSGATSLRSCGNESVTRPEGSSAPHSDDADSSQDSTVGDVRAGRGAFRCSDGHSGSRMAPHRCRGATRPPEVKGHGKILRLPCGEQGPPGGREASLWSVESLAPYVPPSAGRARHQLEPSLWSVESLEPYVPRKVWSPARDPAAAALQESVWSVESLAPYVPQDLVMRSSRDSAPSVWSLKQKREVCGVSPQVPGSGQSCRVSRRVEAALWSIRSEESCSWLDHLGQVYCCGEGRGQVLSTLKRCSCGAVTRRDHAIQRSESSCGSSACPRRDAWRSERDDRKRVCGVCGRRAAQRTSRTRTRTITHQ